MIILSHLWPFLEWVLIGSSNWQTNYLPLTNVTLCEWCTLRGRSKATVETQKTKQLHTNYSETNYQIEWEKGLPMQRKWRTRGWRDSWLSWDWRTGGWTTQQPWSSQTWRRRCRPLSVLKKERNRLMVQNFEIRCVNQWTFQFIQLGILHFVKCASKFANLNF